MNIENNKICLMQQEAGIGDIIFCQTLAEKYLDEGYNVIWPINDEIISIKDYFNPKINFYPKSQDYPYKDKFLELYESRKYVKTENFIFAPLGYSSLIVNERVMHSKYSICGENWTEWKSKFKINRNLNKENKLFYNVLGLNDTDRYCLVNSNYSTPPTIEHYNVTSAFKDLDTQNLKFIDMKLIDGYTVFDWCKVLENATYIVTVDTCTMYIMELLNMKADKLCCFPRWGNYTITQIHDLFKNYWRYYI